MGKSKKIIIGTVSGITAVAVAAGGIFLWRSSNAGKSINGLAYVCAVSDVNTAASFITDMQFSGVVEPQEIKEVKADLSKVISDISVQEGDHVEAGDILFTYDVESMELELQQGNIDIERMENEISSSEQQIAQLESEKKKANADDQLTYTTQIQSLETDIAKTKYDIKTKEVELEKLKNTIKNADVKAEISGTVQSLKTAEQLQTDGGDVIMKIMSDGEFRVKCTVSEQNIYMLYTDEPVIVRSRIDDTTWSGTITEIGTEAESNQNDMMYYGIDEMTTASKYPFYITLDSSEGLMLGQHLLVSPNEGSTVEKEGIWLYSDYIMTDDDGTSYVWASDSKDRLEKRKVEIGQSDDMIGDCEIISGLAEDDLIAFPSDSYEEGMKTTTNAEEAFAEENYEPIDDGMMYDEEGNPAYEDDDMMYDEEDVIFNEKDALVDSDMSEDTLIDSGDIEEGGAADGT